MKNKSIMAYAAVIKGKVVSVPLDFEDETIYQLSVFPSKKEADKTGYDPSIIKKIRIFID